jgi:hypothetical protein
VSKLQTGALIVLFLWNLMLFQWFAGQLSDLRKTISEMGSLQREGDAVRLNRLPYDNNNNAINNNNNNNRIDDGKGNLSL